MKTRKTEYALPPPLIRTIHHSVVTDANETFAIIFLDFPYSNSKMLTFTEKDGFEYFTNIEPPLLVSAEHSELIRLK